MKRAAFVVLAACTEFDPPSALTHTQIIAVRATPPAIAPGERANLDALVAGPVGVLAPDLTWRIAAGPDGVTIEDGAWLAAPAGASGDVVVALVADGLAAEKTVRIGERRENPQIAVTVAGSALADEVRMARSATVELAATIEGPDSSISWFSTIGEVSRYREPTTELVAPNEAGIGTFAVVGRDGQGGVAWKTASIIVD